ncbi:DUF1328 domain-containing protein [Ectothiorhodospiraceae bacterium 2226]|nr:DUF1328 domain-containing protein [Ectothiorhodospiraceae bacterium 2226]
MLAWALVSLVVAVIAAAVGFTGVAAGAAMIAKWLFGIFLLIAVILLILGLMNGGGPAIALGLLGL